jgi:hypothetical protein
MMQIINADDDNGHLLLDRPFSVVCFAVFFLFPSSTLPPRFFIYTILKHVLGNCTYLRQVLLQDAIEGFLISGALPSQEEEI